MLLCYNEGINYVTSMSHNSIRMKGWDAHAQWT